MIHRHRGTWTETLRTDAVWSEVTDTAAELRRGLVTVRARTCPVCGRRDVITERAGRRWRRAYRPTAWTPPEVAP